MRMAFGSILHTSYIYMKSYFHLVTWRRNIVLHILWSNICSNVRIRPYMDHVCLQYVPQHVFTCMLLCKLACVCATQIWSHSAVNLVFCVATHSFSLPSVAHALLHGHPSGVLYLYIRFEMPRWTSSVVRVECNWCSLALKSIHFTTSVFYVPWSYVPSSTVKRFLRKTPSDFCMRTARGEEGGDRGGALHTL